MDNFTIGYIVMGVYCLIVIVAYLHATRRSK